MDPWSSLCWLVIGAVVGSILVSDQIAIRRLKRERAKTARRHKRQLEDVTAELDMWRATDESWRAAGEEWKTELTGLWEENRTLRKKLNAEMGTAAGAQFDVMRTKQHLGSLQEKNTKLNALNQELLGRFKDLEEELTTKAEWH